MLVIIEMERLRKEVVVAQFTISGTRQEGMRKNAINLSIFDIMTQIRSENVRSIAAGASVSDSNGIENCVMRVFIICTLASYSLLRFQP
jgi:hypothetical protein